MVEILAMHYRYEIEGTGMPLDQTFKTTGMIEMDAGNFPKVALQALEETFMALTKGNAVYGQPGKGCRGPYQVTRLLVELI